MIACCSDAVWRPSWSGSQSSVSPVMTLNSYQLMTVCLLSKHTCTEVFFSNTAQREVSATCLSWHTRRSVGTNVRSAEMVRHRRSSDSPSSVISYFPILTQDAWLAPDLGHHRGLTHFASYKHVIHRINAYNVLCPLSLTLIF